MLFFILIAFGEQLLNVNTTDTDNENKYPGLEYYQYAEHLFRLTRPNMCITFIQCGLLLGLYSANLARYNTVYNFLVLPQDQRFVKVIIEIKKSWIFQINHH